MLVFDSASISYALRVPAAAEHKSGNTFEEGARRVNVAFVFAAIAYNRGANHRGSCILCKHELDIVGHNGELSTHHATAH